MHCGEFLDRPLASDQRAGKSGGAWIGSARLNRVRIGLSRRSLGEDGCLAGRPASELPTEIKSARHAVALAKAGVSVPGFVKRNTKYSVRKALFLLTTLGLIGVSLHKQLCPSPLQDQTHRMW